MMFDLSGNIVQAIRGTVISILIVILIWGDGHHCYDGEILEDVINCDVNVIHLNGTGQLPIPTDLAGKQCNYSIDVTDQSVILIVKKLDLSDGDFIAFESVDGSLFLNLTSEMIKSDLNGYPLQNRFIFLGSPKKSTNITLKTTSSVASRVVDIELQLEKVDLTIETESVFQSIKANVSDSINQKMEISFKSTSKSLVINFGPVNSFSLGKDSKISTDSDNILENSGTTNFIVQGSPKDHILDISFYFVNSNCSSDKDISNLTSFVYVIDSDKIKNEVDVRCLTILRGGPKSFLSLGFDDKQIMIPPGNHIVVRKGLKRSSPVILDISQLTYPYVGKDAFNSLMNSSNIFITYEAFTVNGEHPTFNVFRTSKNVLTGNDSVKCSPKSPCPKKVIYQTEGYRASLKNEMKGPLDVDIVIYDSSWIDENSKLAYFKKNDTLPDNIISDTDTLYVEFSDSSTSVVWSFQHINSKLDSVARNGKASLSISNQIIHPNKEYHWILPPCYTQPGMVKSLFFSSLFVEKGASLKITEVGNANVDFTLQGSKDSVESGLSFILAGEKSHVVAYKRPITQEHSNSSMNLLQASVAPIIYDEPHSYQLEKADTVIPFGSYSYPSNYSLIGAGQGLGNGYGNIVSKTPKILVTFDDVDLATESTLELYPGAKITQPNPSDLILDNSVAINFDRSILNSKSSKANFGDQITGRGFSGKLRALSCGDTFSKDITGKISVNTSCYYIISTPMVKDKVQLLNITLASKAPDGLRILDDRSLRSMGDETRFLNLSNHLIFNSSQEYVMIWSDKPDGKTIDMSWTTFECPLIPGYCRNRQRCLLESWRCNGKNECGDWSDELNCNSTIPVPVPKIETKTVGVPYWVLVFIILPLAFVAGFISSKYVPTILSRIRPGGYQSFRTDVDA
ncbi:uncharacterized protein LOC141856262 [Brevipalpus obovatus]|uniref:uncharacterized protein LOC141856262 n=1 Tax=Brevipalpus obovatus TaxID=246614 RepID=UPI003D9E4C9C